MHAFPLSCVTICPIPPPPLFLYIYHHLSYTLFFFFSCFQADPEPLSVYHPTTEEVSAAMGIPMKGFFDGVDIVAKAMASNFAAA